LIRLSHTELIASSLPSARTAIVPGAGHFLPKEDPDRLAQLITDFLDTVT